MIKAVTGRAVHRRCWCQCWWHRQQHHTMDRAWLHRLITKWAKKKNGCHLKIYRSYWPNISCAYMCKMWGFYNQSCGQDDCPQTTTTHDDDNDTWRIFHDYIGSLAFTPNQPIVQGNKQGTHTSVVNAQRSTFLIYIGMLSYKYQALILKHRITTVPV